MQTLIYRWYLFIICLLLISPSTYNFGAVFLSALIFVVVLVAFYFGTISFQGGKSNYVIINYDSRGGVFGMSFILFPTLFLPVFFYSGLTASSFIQIIGSGGYGFYDFYQTNVSESDLSKFTFDQAPYLLMAVSAKLIIVFMAVNSLKFGGVNRKISIEFYFSLVLLCISGFMRGTSVELFEAAVLFAFSKEFFRKTNFRVAVTQLLPVAIIIISIFVVNLELRGASEINCVSRQYCFDSERGLFPNGFFGFIIYQMSGYFSFGIHAVSLALINNELSAGVNLFLPNYDNIEGAKLFIRSSGIDMGVAWTPDIFLLAYSCGIFLALCVVYIVGIIASRMYKKLIYGNIGFVDGALLYYTFLQVLSFPFGNILLSSVPSILSFAIVIAMKFFGVRIKHGLA